MAPGRWHSLQPTITRATPGGMLFVCADFRADMISPVGGGRTFTRQTGLRGTVRNPVPQQFRACKPDRQLIWIKIIIIGQTIYFPSIYRTSHCISEVITMKAGELCNRDVVTAARDLSILEASRLMREHHVGCLVIIEEISGHARPVGILTDRDIVIEVIARDVAVTGVTAGDVMTFTLLKVTEDENIFDVARRMRSRGVRRVPVISNSGDLAGIIALDDLLGLLSQELSLLATITTREAEQEITKRSQPC